MTVHSFPISPARVAAVNTSATVKLPSYESGLVRVRAHLGFTQGFNSTWDNPAPKIIVRMKFQIPLDSSRAGNCDGSAWRTFIGCSRPFLDRNRAGTRPVEFMNWFRPRAGWSFFRALKSLQEPSRVFHVLFRQSFRWLLVHDEQPTTEGNPGSWKSQPQTRRARNCLM